jgi:hypothetical protein
MTDKVTEQINELLKRTDIPRIYANGFMNALGNGDTTIVLQLNGVPVAILNLSYTMSKTLAVKLGNMISMMEDKTGNSIMTTEQIDKALSEAAKK